MRLTASSSVVVADLDDLTEPYHNLAIAVWRQAAADLAAGDRHAWAWLDTPAFVFWASVVAIDADTLRDRLRDTYGSGTRRVSSRRSPWR